MKMERFKLKLADLRIFQVFLKKQFILLLVVEEHQRTLIFFGTLACFCLKNHFYFFYLKFVFLLHAPVIDATSSLDLFFFLNQTLK